VKKGSVSILRWIALLLIFSAVLITVFQLIAYSRVRSTFPPGMVIAGVPVGGLEQQQAADRLVEAYGIPVELHYGNAIIQIKPAVVGFDIDLQGMLAAADMQRINQPFWSAFWDYLWNRLPNPEEVPLRATLSEERLRSYLSAEIAKRYDQPPSSSVPAAGGVSFDPGNAGTTLDVERAAVLISDALRSPSSRVVNLTFNKVAAPRPSMENLEVLLKQIIDTSGFPGITEMYLKDLQTGKEIHFAWQGGQELTPDIAFTAASTIKIPIMVSVFREIGEPTPKDVDGLLSLMVERSENDPADKLMEVVLERNYGPLKVTDNMKVLGLENTFLAGYFFPGAPLLQRFKTPANSRADINTSPDDYNQTTVTDMGMLLNDIYECAEMGGGTLMAAFPGEVTQNECKEMINYLSLNDIPVLIQGGVPETTKVAHKHGWIIENDGYMHTMGDVAILYTPGGNYVFTIFIHQQDQLLFDLGNEMVIKLSKAIYNFFNIAVK
jgi:beta-lactamase class A